MRRFTLLLLFALSATAQTPLSLRDAVSQALSTHPLLSAGAGRVAASEGLWRQAALRPNPRMFFQVENLRGHGQPGFVYGCDADT